MSVCHKKCFDQIGLELDMVYTWDKKDKTVHVYSVLQTCKQAKKMKVILTPPPPSQWSICPVLTPQISSFGGCTLSYWNLVGSRWDQLKMRHQIGTPPSFDVYDTHPVKNKRNNAILNSSWSCSWIEVGVELGNIAILIIHQQQEETRGAALELNSNSCQIRQVLPSVREGVKNILRGGSLVFRGGTYHIHHF